ncbi:MAG: zinc ribbon domain-containing protein [Bacillota bacterium]|nr:zinc ribbon domain-containing protein [Bacillota bacterium]
MWCRNTSTGKTHRYYTCTNAPKKCDKKNVRKEELEPIVLETCRDLLTDEVIDSVVAAVEEQNKVDQESPSIIRLKGDIKDTEKKIEKLLNQIEDGTGSARVSQRLQKREDELDILKKS